MKKSIIVLLHLGYWTLFLTLMGIVLLCLNIEHKPNFLVLCFAGYSIIPALLGFYAFYTVLFDKFLPTKKVLSLFGVGIGAAWLSGLVGSMCMQIMSSFGLGLTLFNDGLSSAFAITNFMAFVALLNGGMGLLLKGFVKWFDDIKLKEDLAKKNFETELALVKSQLNPHFLFNTLNNIDVLIEKDAPKASVYLKKLSDIMRFMLYETKGEQIPLSKELDYVAQYIELQKLRTINPNFIQYSVEGNPKGVMIAPLLFIPFVENAFKHTEGGKVDNAIVLKIKIEKARIHFQCTNQHLPMPLNQEGQNGLGNNLIEKRLALLYPNKHTLTIQDNKNAYSVDLVIHP
jgi:two-component system, LytTR family, sensor kinase